MRDTDIDYYSILGIPPTASEAEIRLRYRFLVLAFHPDKFGRNPEHHALAEQRVKQVNEAYGILSDPERRAAYDRSLRSAPRTFGEGAESLAGGGILLEFQRELEQLRAHLQRTERDLTTARLRLEAMQGEKETLHQRLLELERAQQAQQQLADVERRQASEQASSAAKARSATEHTLRLEADQAAQKARVLAEDLARKDVLLEQVQQAKAEFEQSSRERMQSLSQQVSKLKKQVTAKNEELAQLRQAKSNLEQQLAAETIDAGRSARQWTDLLYDREAEIAELKEQHKSSERTDARRQRYDQLWKIAAVVGLVNTVILLSLLLALR